MSNSEIQWCSLSYFHIFTNMKIRKWTSLNLANEKNEHQETYSTTASVKDPGNRQNLSQKCTEFRKKKQSFIIWTLEKI